MNKKVCCTCEVVVLLIKPIVFLTFSLPSASLDLKVPNVFKSTCSHYKHTDRTIFLCRYVSVVMSFVASVNQRKGI